MGQTTTPSSIYSQEFMDHVSNYQNQTPKQAQWWDPLSIAADYATEKYRTQGPSSAQLQQSINPLEESYKNLLFQAGQYADPNSQMNVQMRDNIRGQNLDAMTDITRRAANEATGMVDDSISSRNLSQNAISTAIANALENYNKGHADRMRMSSDLYGKAGAAANTLASARQQNLMYQQGMREKQADAMSGIGGQVFDFLEGGGIGQTVDAAKGAWDTISSLWS
tara:strand:+ start:875 stop:1546 length:672 start_codon:yes stop_codon:yes gene_type:complete